MYRVTALLIFTCIFFSCDKNSSIIKLSPLFSDGMVLQRNTKINIWGSALPNKDVKVISSWSEELEIKSNDSGIWVGKLQTPGAGGPFSLKIISENENIIIHNILIGEVWLASGQSNMEMPIKGYPPNDTILNWESEVLKARYPNIRMFNVEKNFSTDPSKELNGSWIKASPENAENFSSTAYFFSREIHKTLNVPIGIIHSSWGGSPAESWTSENKLRDLGFFIDTLDLISENMTDDLSFSNGQKKIELSPFLPKVLFNGMINPLIPFSIKGVIWYQGESNVGRHKQYMHLFPGLIEDWRDYWGEDFPFYFVQIAPFRYNKTPGIDDISQELREAQRKTLRLPKTGMVVTLDIGDYDNIHPANKQDVGKRLARLALFNDYDAGLSPMGPILKSRDLFENSIRLEFVHTGTGLLYIDNQNKQFQIASANMQFFDANVILNGDYVIISSEFVTSPKYVKYAWSDTPEATLFNSEALPASSFMIEVK